MESMNEALFEAVSDQDKNKIMAIFQMYNNKPKLYRNELNIDEALNISITTQNLDLIKLFLNVGANAKYTDDNGRRAIHLAAETGDIDIVKLILKEGFPVNIPNREGKTPLHLAIETGNETLVQLLINAGANINRAQIYQTNEYPIHVAVKKGFIHIINLLKSKGANLDATAAYKRTPLHYAIIHKQFCTVEHLCKLHVNVNAQDIRGDTPLAIALSHGLMPMVHMLLRFDAKVDILLRNDVTALHYIPQLMNKQSEPGAHGDLYETLIRSAGDCINRVTDNGTPLHAAVSAKSLLATKLFLDSGADINAEGNGYTPLALAVGSNDEQIVELLVSRGAKLHGRNVGTSFPQYDGNVLHSLLMAQGLPARRSKTAALKQLIAAGCQLNQMDLRGFTPLDRHIYSTVPDTGRAEVVELVQSGAMLEREIETTGRASVLILRMRQQGRRDRRSSSILMCTWHGDLDTANYLVTSSCITCHVLRQHDWLTLPGRDDQSEEFLEYCRELIQSPEPLTRLCRIEIRRYLSISTGDRDIREKLGNLPVPSMIFRFLNLTEETTLYLSRSSEFDMQSRLQFQLLN